MVNDGSTASKPGICAQSLPLICSFCTDSDMAARPTPMSPMLWELGAETCLPIFATSCATSQRALTATKRSMQQQRSQLLRGASTFQFPETGAGGGGGAAMGGDDDEEEDLYA